MSEPIPNEVAAAYGFEGVVFERMDGGLINDTYCVRAAGGRPLAVLQRLHRIFAAEVNLDVEAVTRCLRAAGLETPELIPSAGGALWVEHDGAIWRALTHMEGYTIAAVTSPAQAEVAAELVGRFHRAVAPLEAYQFRFTRLGVHDTAAHLARLRAAAGEAAGFAEAAEAAELAAEILAAAGSRPRWATIPERVSHGDLKISNIRFAALEPPAARCLLDLDTLGRLTLAYELGDAMRSWCNAATEDNQPRWSDEIFAAAIAGYRRATAGWCSELELAAVPAGTATVCFELAARFCNDVFADEYFGWDSSRYPSRRAHNLARARAQLALGRHVVATLDELVAAASNH
jgi:hypothetical protein